MSKNYFRAVAAANVNGKCEREKISIISWQEMLECSLKHLRTFSFVTEIKLG
jgi:hypothetical protein